MSYTGDKTIIEQANVFMTTSLIENNAYICIKLLN